MSLILPDMLGALAALGAALTREREPLSFASAVHLTSMEQTRKEKWDYIRHLVARKMITEETHQQLVKWMKAKIDFMSTNNTYNVLLNGPSKAHEIMGRLIDECCWFTLEPYPNDHWMLTVKKEPGPLKVLRELDIPGPGTNSHPVI